MRIKNLLPYMRTIGSPRPAKNAASFEPFLWSKEARPADPNKLEIDRQEIIIAREKSHMSGRCLPYLS
jgi:hypothetical protein